jgi:putative endonuclease
MVVTRILGNFGEDIAVKILQSKGYKIVQRNYRCKLGELDIIAEKNDYLVFIEVKTRWTDKFGKPEEAVDKRKLAKLYRMVEYYLTKTKITNRKIRLEVVALDIRENKINDFKIITVD